MCIHCLSNKNRKKPTVRTNTKPYVRFGKEVYYTVMDKIKKFKMMFSVCCGNEQNFCTPATIHSFWLRKPNLHVQFIRYQGHLHIKALKIQTSTEKTHLNRDLNPEPLEPL
jgi:hypothetical protein